MTKYRIETDRHNWILAEKRVAGDKATKREKGSVSWVGVKFFGSLTHLAQYLADESMRQCYVEGASAEELQRIADGVLSRVEALIKEHEARTTNNA